MSRNMEAQIRTSQTPRLQGLREEAGGKLIVQMASPLVTTETRRCGGKQRAFCCDKDGVIFSGVSVE